MKQLNANRTRRSALKTIAGTGLAVAGLGVASAPAAGAEVEEWTTDQEHYYDTYYNPDNNEVGSGDGYIKQTLGVKRVSREYDSDGYYRHRLRIFNTSECTWSDNDDEYVYGDAIEHGLRFREQQSDVEVKGWLDPYDNDYVRAGIPDESHKYDNDKDELPDEDDFREDTPLLDVTYSLLTVIIGAGISTTAGTAISIGTLTYGIADALWNIDENPSNNWTEDLRWLPDYEEAIASDYRELDILVPTDRAYGTVEFSTYTTPYNTDMHGDNRKEARLEIDLYNPSGGG